MFRYTILGTYGGKLDLHFTINLHSISRLIKFTGIKIYKMKHIWREIKESYFFPKQNPIFEFYSFLINYILYQD